MFIRVIDPKFTGILTTRLSKLHLDLWEKIFELLRDKDIIALNGVNTESRKYFACHRLYTRRFWKRWRVTISLKAFGLTMINRDRYR